MCIIITRVKGRSTACSGHWRKGKGSRCPGTMSPDGLFPVFIAVLGKAVPLLIPLERRGKEPA